MIKFLISIIVFLFVAKNTVSGQNDLNFYISNAISNSPLLNDFQNQVKINSLDNERLMAIYTKAQIGVSASYIFSPIINLDNSKARVELNAQNASKYIGYDIAASNGGQYLALLNVNQPLMNKGNLKTAMEQNNISSQIGQNNIVLTSHDITKFVIDQYLLCLLDLKQSDYTNTMTLILTEQKELVKELIDASVLKQSDLSLINIELSNFQLLYSINKNTYLRDLMDLNILCGLKDTSMVKIKETELNFTMNTNNSNFIEKYKLDSLSIQSSVNVMELKYKPQINLIANTGLNAVFAPTIPSRFGINAGINFSYSIYDGKQKNINRNKAEVLEQTISFNKEFFVNQNQLRKVKIMNEISSYESRIAIINQQMAEYEKLMNLYKKEIITGQLSIINYIAVLKNMASTQRDSAALLSQKQLLINTYNYWNW